MSHKIEAINRPFDVLDGQQCRILPQIPCHKSETGRETERAGSLQTEWMTLSFWHDLAAKRSALRRIMLQRRAERGTWLLNRARADK